jgi:hypothetical protein
MRAMWRTICLVVAIAGPAAAQGPGQGPAGGPGGGGPMMQGQGPGGGAMMRQGPGGGPGAMMGPAGTVSPGMMMRGRGPGWMMDDDEDAWRWHPGPLSMFGPVDRKLSLDEVQRIVEAQLAWLRNDRLKVGAVKEKDDDTATVDIVTKEGSALVTRLEVDRTSAGMRAVP